MFPLPCFTEELSNFPWMLYQTYGGHNGDLLTEKALSCFHVTIKCSRRSIQDGPKGSPCSLCYTFNSDLHACIPLLFPCCWPFIWWKSVPAADMSFATSLVVILGFRWLLSPWDTLNFDLSPFGDHFLVLIWLCQLVEILQLQPGWLLGEYLKVCWCHQSLSLSHVIHQLYHSELYLIPCFCNHSLDGCSGNIWRFVDVTKASPSLMLSTNCITQSCT